VVKTGITEKNFSSFANVKDEILTKVLVVTVQRRLVGFSMEFRAG
jgi:hypothetical protein